MTGGAIDSMEQLNELQDMVSELEELGVTSPELEAEIKEIEDMIKAVRKIESNPDIFLNKYISLRFLKKGYDDYIEWTKDLF